MINKLIFISILIMAILFVTWVKDGESMNPPIKRRIIIDSVTIGIFWLLYFGFFIASDGTYDNEIKGIIDISLLFFTFRLVQLVAKLNPIVSELITFIKERNDSKNNKGENK